MKWDHSNALRVFHLAILRCCNSRAQSAAGDSSHLWIAQAFIIHGDKINIILCIYSERRLKDITKYIYITFFSPILTMGNARDTKKKYNIYHGGAILQCVRPSFIRWSCYLREVSWDQNWIGIPRIYLKRNLPLPPSFAIWEVSNRVHSTCMQAIAIFQYLHYKHNQSVYLLSVAWSFLVDVVEANNGGSFQINLNR